MKMRWRALTRSQLESGDLLRGAVTIARNVHYSELAVLEFQPDEQKDFWTQVPLYFPGRSDGLRLPRQSDSDTFDDEYFQADGGSEPIRMRD